MKKVFTRRQFMAAAGVAVAAGALTACGGSSASTAGSAAGSAAASGSTIKVGVSGFEFGVGHGVSSLSVRTVQSTPAPAESQAAVAAWSGACYTG